jgi:hypothetical protein
MGLPSDECLHRPADELRDGRAGPAVLPAGLRQEKASRAVFEEVVVGVLSSRYTARNETFVLVVLASPFDSIAHRAF